MSGSGLVQNDQLVELLEEEDELDLILDLGDEFKYRLKSPKISAGKVFAPKVKSTLQFVPTSPWIQLGITEFENLIKELNFLQG